MQIPEPLQAQRWEEVGCFALCFFPQPSRLRLLVLLIYLRQVKVPLPPFPLRLALVAPQCAPLLRGCQGWEWGLLMRR